MAVAELLAEVAAAEVKMKNKNKLNAKRISILLFGIIFALNLVSADFGDGTCFGMIGGYGFGNTFGLIFQILIVAAFALLIAWLIKDLQNSKGGKRK